LGRHFAGREAPIMRIPVFVILSSVAATATFAGTYLESADAPSGSQQAARVTRMWFDGGRMRTENGGKGEGSIAIFKNNSMYIVDPASRSYRVIDKPTLDQMAARLGEARKKMEASMAGMPPERRAMMEKMLGQIPGGAAAPKRVLKNTGRTETVAGIKCTVWEASVSGQKEEELCVAAPKALAGGEDMMKTLHAVGDMLKDFSQSFGSGSKTDSTWRDLDTVKGMPILMRDFSGGKVSSENRLSVVRKESVPAAQFDVPAGYTEKKVSFGPPAAQ
jgi:hypothetical protein